MVASSLMHTFTFLFIYLKYTFGYYDEMIDFKELDDEGTTYNLVQGFRYHYWGNSTKYENEIILV